MARFLLNDATGGGLDLRPGGHGSRTEAAATAKVVVYSDYVCPFCLFAKEILQEVTAGKAVEVEWRPFELRPHPTPTLRPEGDYLRRVWRDVVYPMAKRLGISIVLPRISPQPYTHLAFEGFQYAREHGAATEYNDRMLRAFFQEERDIGDIDVLTELAAEIGLDRDGFHEALTTRRYKEAHLQALAHAYQEAHITAVPTLFVGGHRIEGVPRREALERLIDQEIAARREVTA